MDPGAPGIPGPVPAPEFPPSPVSLPAGEIHVWIADLDRLPEADASSPGTLLDPQEQERSSADVLDALPPGARRRCH